VRRPHGTGIRRGAGGHSTTGALLFEIAGPSESGAWLEVDNVGLR